MKSTFLLPGGLPPPAPAAARAIDGRTVASPPFIRHRQAALACTLLAILVAGLAPAAHAQDNAVLTLGRVQVQAIQQGSLPARRVITSVDVVGAEQIQDQHVDNTWELFGRVPGIQLTPFRMGTVGGSFSFRGFNAEGRVNAVKLLIDGVPSNSNAGDMPFLDSVFPLDIAAIEVVRGTNDARHGLNAIAGSVDILTRGGGDDGALRVTVGSHGSDELQLAKGFEHGPWSQNYFFGWRGSNGYRDHAEAVKRNFAGKWFYDAADGRWRAGLSTRYYHDSAQEPGYFTAYAAAKAAPREAVDYARQDQGERMIAQTALHLDGQLAAAWSWSAKAYVNRYRNTRYVRFSAAGSQQERDSDETQRGVLASTTWRPRAALALEAGVEGQWQDNVARRWRTAARQRQAATRDWNYDLHVASGYVQAVWQASERLRIVPAYRVDQVGGQLHDRLGGASYSTYGYGLIKQPKLSLAYAFDPRLTGYANWGRTFQIGSGDGAYRTTTHDLGPSLNDGWEAGLKFTPSDWLDGRVAYWEQRASGEVATVLGAAGTGSDVANVGRTLRRGWDVQANLQAGERWSGWLSWSRQKATVVAAAADAPDTEGHEIENVPRWLAAAGLDYQATPSIKLSAWGNAQGDYYLERSNQLGRYGSRALANLGVSWAVNERDSLALQLKNLGNRFYVYAWYEGGSYGYSPGDGRALYLSWSRSL